MCDQNNIILEKRLNNLTILLNRSLTASLLCHIKLELGGEINPPSGALPSLLCRGFGCIFLVMC